MAIWSTQAVGRRGAVESVSIGRVVGVRAWALAGPALPKNQVRPFRLGQPGEVRRGTEAERADLVFR